MAVSLPEFAHFDTSPEAGDVSVRWKKWIQRFKTLMLAMDITNNDRKQALLMHYSGEEVNELFDVLTVDPPAEGENNFDKSVQALSDYFSPTENTDIEVMKFRKLKQGPNEDIMEFITRLKQSAALCDFHDKNQEIRRQLMEKTTDSKLRLKILGNKNWSLADCIKEGRNMEINRRQGKLLEDELNTHSESVSRMKITSPPHRHSRNQHTPFKRYKKPHNQQPSAVCRNCGNEYPHKKGRTSCPAFGKKCHKCSKNNHFAKCCLSQGNTDFNKKVNQVTISAGKESEPVNSAHSSDSESYVYAVRNSAHCQLPIFKVHVDGCKMELMADSGSSVCLMDEKDYKTLKHSAPLMKNNTPIYPYGTDTPLCTMGSFTAMIDSGKIRSQETFHVIEGQGGSLLSWSASRKLRLIDTVDMVNTITTKSETFPSVLSEFPNLFTGIGKLKCPPVKLHINKNIRPVAQPHRRVPFHVRKQLEEQLKRDEEFGIIERVNDGATPWVSPLVIVPKPKYPGKIRVCVDMRAANCAIERERHLTPTVSEVISDLNGAAVFTKLDLNQGYNQLELAEESRYITTFSTHDGLWRYKRLSFGVNSAAEVFQKNISNILSDIGGALNISDDILVYGTSQAEHDKNLRATLQRLSDSGLTLNKSKCVFNQETLEFFGYVFNKSGMSPDLKKVRDIQNLKTPTDQSTVRSLLGMTNFFARFIPDYATLTEPLHQLTKKNIQWEWSQKHDNAVSVLQAALSSAPVLSYFNIEKDTEVYVDASPVGLGAILVQDGRTVAYASRALTNVEQRYSQTDREALAVVWSCERFHLYVYGKPVKVFTDHKPLVHIYGNPRSHPPARIERWAMRLQPYDATIIYRAGSLNPADYLSRSPPSVLITSSRESKIAEEYINFISMNSVPKAMSLSEIQAATLSDTTLQAVISSIHDGKWHTHVNSPMLDIDAFRSLKQVSDELSAVSNLLLRGTRIVMPVSLQSRAVRLAHEGHQGIVKTKAIIREKIWFPGIDYMVENLVKSCHPCQVVTMKSKREPLKMSPLPTGPWRELSADFGEVHHGRYLLVVTDDYSRFPLVEIISSTSANTVLPVMDKIFSEFGIPDVLRTDNGPPFNSNKFDEFAKSLGFHHRKVTPRWPRSNGEVERFMKTIKSSINAARIERKCWKQEMYRFLRNYRATPHTSTGQPPATLLYGRPIKTKLPELVPDRTRLSSWMSKHKIKLLSRR